MLIRRKWSYRKKINLIDEGIWKLVTKRMFKVNSERDDQRLAGGICEVSPKGILGESSDKFPKTIATGI